MTKLLRFPVSPEPLAVKELLTAKTLSEAFAERAADASVVGFVAAALQGAERPVLWVQDRLSLRETGQPYMMQAQGVSVLRVCVNRAVDVLQALEDGLACAALAGVVGEVWGAPPALSFTATKRLAMRAEQGGRPCWLIRRGATPDLSAARNRWRISALPSEPNPLDPRAPGVPRWQAELFRARSVPPGTWVVTHERAGKRAQERASDRLDFSPRLAHRTLDPVPDAGGQSAHG